MPTETENIVQAPTSVAETLRRARVLIEDPKHWLKTWYARVSPRGEHVHERDPRARCFCAMGAIGHVDGPYQMAATDLLRRLTPGNSIVDFNDARATKHEDVLALFDRALALAEAPTSEHGEKAS